CFLAAPVRSFRNMRDVFLPTLSRFTIDPAQILANRALGQSLLAGNLHYQPMQHVEVVAFAEQILGPLQFRTPGAALLGQEALDHIAEAFDGYAQLVPALGVRLFCPAVV